MKKAMAALLALLALVWAVGCGASKAPSEPQEEPAAQEAGYIWTITIDEEKAMYLDEALDASVTSALQLSASKAGGETPYGVYRGELNYSYVTDFGILAAFLETADADGWGKNDAFEFELVPFDADAFSSFEAASRGAQSVSSPDDTANGESTDAPALAPLLNSYAMHCGDALPFTEQDFSTDVTLPAGLFDLLGDSEGITGGFDLGEFGAFSASGDMQTPFSIQLVEPAELPVQFTIYGGAQPWVFRGVIDKVPLSDTIAVG